MLCDDLGVGGRLRREGAYVYIEPKLIQHCKEVVLQLKGKQDNPLPTPARYLNGPPNSIGGWGSETGGGGILKVGYSCPKDSLIHQTGAWAGCYSSSQERVMI